MSAGTITLTHNSAAVTGAGTAFTTDLKAGDIIASVVGGVTYTLPVKTVNSAASVTLIKNYDGPTQAGAAWSAVPRDAMNAITAQLAAETAQALRGLNYDKQNWQLVFSSNGNITVRLPDGSTFSGPSWNSIVSALNEKADSNDERFETIDGKTGGVIKSPITGFGIPGGTSVLAPWEASPYRVNDRFSPTYDSYMPTLSYGVGGNNGGWRSMISSGAVARQSAHPICIIASVGYDYDLNSRESREGHNLSYERSSTGAPIMGSGRPDGSGYYSVTFNISSDERMKSDIKDLPNECALKKICALNYISFRFNECSGRNTKELRRGFSAQQAMIVDPQYVSVDRPSSLVNQSENIEVLRLDSNVLLLDALAAIKALNEKIEYLQSKLNEWKRE